MNTDMYKDTDTDTDTCTYTYIYIHIHIYIYIYLYIETYMCVYVCGCRVMSCAARRWVVGWLGVVCCCRHVVVVVVFVLGPSLLRMMSILQRARAERSMIKRRVRQCKERVVLDLFSNLKWVRSSGYFW